MLLPTVVPVYAALLTLLYIVLTVLVGRYRWVHKVNLGDGGVDGLQRRIRAHGNFGEYVPLGLILLLIIEVLGAAVGWLHVWCLMLLVGRVLHACGLIDGEFKARVVGQMLTLAALIGAAIYTFILVSPFYF